MAITVGAFHAAIVRVEGNRKRGFARRPRSLFSLLKNALLIQCKISRKINHKHAHIHRKNVRFLKIFLTCAFL